jgi:hypothetical protein
MAYYIRSDMAFIQVSLDRRRQWATLWATFEGGGARGR